MKPAGSSWLPAARQMVVICGEIERVAAGARRGAAPPAGRARDQGADRGRGDLTGPRAGGVDALFERAGVAAVVRGRLACARAGAVLRGCAVRAWPRPRGCSASARA